MAQRLLDDYRRLLLGPIALELPPRQLPPLTELRSPPPAG
jgi:hypothetical protein